MASTTFELPTMYGDHHVVEVRRLLFEMPGVKEVYASSGFGVVEVEFDEAEMDAAAMEAKLAAAGYSKELASPVEVGATQKADGKQAFFRNTAAYKQTGRSVGFAQNVPYSGQPLWPCPGIGVIENMKE